MNQEFAALFQKYDCEAEEVTIDGKVCLLVSKKMGTDKSADRNLCVLAPLSAERRIPVSPGSSMYHSRNDNWLLSEHTPMPFKSDHRAKSSSILTQMLSPSLTQKPIDVELVQSQTNATYEQAAAELQRCDGDVVQAIMVLTYTLDENDNSVEQAESRDTTEEIYDLQQSAEKDIGIVQAESGATREEAVAALQRNRGDVVNAIMELTF